MICQACRTRRHGGDCDGCDCPCRAFFAGPDGLGDPTAPGADEGQVA